MGQRRTARRQRGFFKLTRQIFAEAGFQLDRVYWGTEYLGNAKHSFQIALELGMPRELARKVVGRRNEAFMTSLERPIPLLPDVRRTIEALAGHVRLALVTGSPLEKLERMHGESGLLDHFEVIVTEDDISHPKPHAEPYLKALEQLGVDAGDCLAVEDSLRGFASAHAAGISCIVVPNTLIRIQRFDQAFAVEERVRCLETRRSASGRNPECRKTRIVRTCEIQPLTSL